MQLQVNVRYEISSITALVHLCPPFAVSLGLIHNSRSAHSYTSLSFLHIRSFL